MADLSLAQVFVQAKLRMDRTAEEARLKTQAAGLGITVPVSADFRAARAQADRESKNIAASIAKNLNALPFLGGLGESGVKAVATGIIAGAPIINAALLSTFAAGGIATGIAISFQDTRVKAAMSQLGQSILVELSKAAEPFTERLLSVIPVIQQGFANIAPNLGGIFDTLSGPLDNLATGISDFISRLMPGFEAAARAGSEVLDVFAQLLPGLGDSVSQFFLSLSSGVGGAKEGMETFMKLLGAVVEDLGLLFGGLSKTLQPVFALLNTLAPILQPLIAIVGLVVIGFKAWNALLALNAVRLELTALGSLVASGAMTSLAGAEATAALGAEALQAALGPIGWVLLAISAVVALFVASSSSADQATKTFANTLLTLGKAYQEGNTASSQTVQNMLAQDETLRKLIDTGAKYGITQDTILKATSGNVEAQKQLTDALKQYGDSVAGIQPGDSLWEIFKKDFGAGDSDAKELQNALKQEIELWNQLQAAQEKALQADLNSTDSWIRATAQAQLYDVALKKLTDDFKLIASPITFVTSVVDQFFQAFNQPIIDAIDHQAAFAEANKAVATAVQNNGDAIKKANSNVNDSIDAVTQARKGETQAAQDLTKAQQGEIQARKDLVKAQNDEKDAQKNLNTARKEALEQLKELHKQIRDIADNEEEANIRLAQAQLAEVQTRGVDPSSLQRRQVLVDLSEAQKSFNDLKEQDVALVQKGKEADKKGVEGSDLVVSAKQRIADAEERIGQARQGIVDAHQRVVDAEDAIGQAQGRTAKAVEREVQARKELATLQNASPITRQLVEAQLNASRQIFNDRVRELIGQGKSQADATNIAAAEYEKRNEAIRKNDEKLGGNKTMIDKIVKAYSIFKELPDIQKVIGIALNSKTTAEVQKQIDEIFKPRIIQFQIQEGFGSPSAGTVGSQSLLPGYEYGPDGKVRKIPGFTGPTPNPAPGPPVKAPGGTRGRSANFAFSFGDTSEAGQPAAKPGTFAYWVLTSASQFKTYLADPINTWFSKSLPGLFTNTKKNAPTWTSFWDSIKLGWDFGFSLPIGLWFDASLPGMFSGLTKNGPGWSGFWTTLKNNWNTNFGDPISNWFTTTLPNFLGHGAASMINSVIGILNQGIGLINAVSSKFGVTIDTIKPLATGTSSVAGATAALAALKAADGGPVAGPGTATSDSIPAWLSNGEFVHNAAAVNYYGKDFMKDLNARKIPRLATGGSIDEIIAVAKRSGLNLGELHTNPAGYHGSPHGRTGGYHDVNKAVDFGGGAGVGTEEAKIAKWWKDNFGSKLLEEIWTPPSGYNGIYIKNGKLNSDAYGVGTKDGHRDHVHIAANEGFSKGLIGKLLGTVSGWVNSAGEFLTNELLDPLVGKTVGLLNPLGFVGQLGGGVLKSIVDNMISSGGEGGGGNTVSGSLGEWINEAIRLTGVPSSWAGGKGLVGLYTLIMRESGGNPNSINLWDSNAKAGHPSQGLMQTIPDTFKSYHEPGTSWKITDPIANIAAGINYILARYGDISKVQQADPNKSPKGYDQGGWLTDHGVNRTGKPEAVLTPDESQAFVKLVKGMNGQSGDYSSMSRADKLELAQLIAQALRTGPEINVNMDGEVVARRSEESVADLLGGV